MLHRHIKQFIDYSKLADFSIRSIQALSVRLNEFESFLNIQRIRSVKRVKYSHLIDFAASYRNPSIHVTKSRVWALRHLYHFLTLRQIVPENIASSLLYPKAEKIGIKARITPRVLRHSFATEMYHQKVPLNAIGHMMGHDSIAETSIYVHVSDKLKQLALDNIHISRRSPWL